MTIKEKAEYLENLLEENKKVQKEIRRKNLELSALNKISLIVSQSLDLNEILKLAVTELRKIVGEKGVAIFLIDPAKTELILAAQEGFSDEFVESIRQLDINEGLAGRVARERTPMAYDDYTRFPEAIEPAVKTEKIKSLLSVPLMSIDNILGVLNVASKTPYHFTPEEINLMTLIGNQIGPAMERAQLHEEIKESERKYKTLVEDINDGYFVCQKGKIVFANRAFLDMYGRDRDEVLNSDSAKFLPADCVQKISRMARDRMAGKTAPEFLEFARRHKDGRELPTEVKVAFSQFNGRPAMIGMFRDVSERKRMEQQILENERLASIGRVSSILAHEIRNPLSSIKTNIQVLSRKLNLEGFDKKRLEIAHAEIKRLERVLQDMLDFARPMTMKKSAHSIDDIIDKCLALLESSFKSGRISIARKKLRTRKKVLVDGEKMEEALLNILLNSADAMSKGGTIRIATGSARHDGRKAVRIEIQDTGAGIPLDEVDKIFDPFFSTKTGGVGLGLTNVKRIIEAHEGIIEVHSSVNEGTLFAITVPER
jgi:PAS domain S-box-containing protein